MSAPADTLAARRRFRDRPLRRRRPVGFAHGPIPARRSPAGRGPRGPIRDENWFTEYVRTFPGADLTVVLTFSGSFMPEKRVPCATGVLELRRDGGHRAVSLAEVPPVLLAEYYADYAPLGHYDPDWRERIRLW